MQEQEKLSDVAAELELRYRQAEIINSVKAPSCEKFWLAEGKAGIWFIPACALAGHFWFLCFLDWYYGLGWKMALHLADSDILELTLCLTVVWVVFAPMIMAASFDMASINHDWPKQRQDYTKRLEKAIEHANFLTRKLPDEKVGPTMREFHEATKRMVRMITGGAIPTLEDFERPPGLNPYNITPEMIRGEQEESRGASCLMPRI